MEHFSYESSDITLHSCVVETKKEHFLINKTIEVSKIRAKAIAKQESFWYQQNSILYNCDMSYCPFNVFMNEISLHDYSGS